MSSVSVGRVLRRGACAGAVGALVVAGLGSGAAVADDVPQTDELAIHSPYDVTATVAPEGGVAQYRPLTLGLTHSNDTFALTDGRLTVDASGLAGCRRLARAIRKRLINSPWLRQLSPGWYPASIRSM